MNAHSKIRLWRGITPFNSHYRLVDWVLLIWLFFSLNSGAYCQQDPARPIRDISFIRELSLPNNTTNIGSALTVTADGLLMALLNQPVKIVAWDIELKLKGDISGVPPEAIHPTDISTTNRMEILFSDPLSGKLFRLNRRLNLESPISFTSINNRVEPAGACTMIDGSMYVLNQADSDLWRLNRQGALEALGLSIYSGGMLRNPTRLALIETQQQLAILDGESLNLYDPVTGRSKSILHGVGNPLGLGIIDEKVWIAGDGLVCFDLQTLNCDYRLSVETLPSDFPMPIADVQPLNNDQLIILTRVPAKVAVFKIYR
jgi:hypothetical protein